MGPSSELLLELAKGGVKLFLQSGRTTEKARFSPRSEKLERDSCLGFPFNKNGEGRNAHGKGGSLDSSIHLELTD